MPAITHDVTLLRNTTDLTNGGQLLPGTAYVAHTTPGPVSISTAGANAAGNPRIIRATGAAGRAGYYGYQRKPTLAVGEAGEIWKGVVMDGFANVLPGKPVFVTDDWTTDTAGLTHTPPGEAQTVVEIPLGTVSATAAQNVIVPAGVDTLLSAELAVKDAIAAHDTNYWTFALTNKGAAGDGTTPMLAATDASTTKATGGSGLTAYVARALALHATAGNAAVTPGHVLEFSATKASSAGNLTQTVLRLVFTSATTLSAMRIGVGVTTNKIRFD